MEAVLESIPNQPPRSKQTLWEERVVSWQASGLSQKAWCEREGVPLSTLRYWRQKLRGGSAPDLESEPASRFIPVSLTQAKTALTIRAGGLSIEVAPDIDLDLLENVLRILKAA
jgi:transposase-like protein